MAIPPRPIGSLTDSGLQQTQGTTVEVNAPEDFAGGAEVLQSPDGSALVQSILENAENIEVETEEYVHDANLAEIVDDSILSELSSDLRGAYEEDTESRSQWQEAYTKGLDLLGIKYS